MNAPARSNHTPLAEVTTCSATKIGKPKNIGESANIRQTYRVDSFELHASQRISDNDEIFPFCQSEIVAFLQLGHTNFFMACSSLTVARFTTRFTNIKKSRRRR
jgi:hypothetical protein